MKADYPEWFNQFMDEDALGSDSRTNPLQVGETCRTPDPEQDRWDGHGSRKRTSQSQDIKASVPWPRKKVEDVRKLRLNLI